MKLILDPTNENLKACKTRTCEFFIAGHGKNVCDAHFSQVTQRLKDFLREHPKGGITTTAGLVQALNIVMNRDLINGSEVAKPKALTIAQELIVPPPDLQKSQLHIPKFKTQHFFSISSEKKDIKCAKLSPILISDQVQVIPSKTMNKASTSKPAKQGYPDPVINPKTGRPMKKKKLATSMIILFIANFIINQFK